jgi:hypothetical protein
MNKNDEVLLREILSRLSTAKWAKREITKEARQKGKITKSFTTSLTGLMFAINELEYLIKWYANGGGYKSGEGKRIVTKTDKRSRSRK